MALNLVQVVAKKTDTLRLLEDAYDQRLGIDGDRAIVLDSVLDTARSRGFCGSLELAVGLLQVSGRFHVQRGPGGAWRAVRQSTALVPLASDPRSTALVPVQSPLGSRALVPVGSPSWPVGFNWPAATG